MIPEICLLSDRSTRFLMIITERHPIERPLYVETFRMVHKKKKERTGKIWQEEPPIKPFSQ